MVSTRPQSDPPADAGPLRLAVVGARRERQGTGEFVARELARAGCRVEAVVGTRSETVAEALEGLEARHGIRARGYTSLEALLDREAVDAVAVCSPPEAHLEALELAAGAGCHAFCEKPLHWEPGLTAETARERVGPLVERFADRGLRLVQNTQWPFTLEAFRRLHPDAPEGPPARFRMWLAPRSRGPRMVVDSAPHFLSMLVALAGPGRLEDVAADESRGGEALTLRCAYAHEGGRIEAELALERRPEQPRPAGYALDGRVADRRVELADYSISFVADDRPRNTPVPCRDPLAASVDAFVRSVRSGPPPDRPVDPGGLVSGLAQLAELVQALRGEFAWPSR